MQSLLRDLLLGGGNATSLNFNFVDGSPFPGQITFTRASSATRFNSSGVLETVGNDVARLDFDPATLAPRGLLVEEQRQNLFQRSEEFNDAYWTLLGATVSANSTAAPTGTNVADTLVEDTSTGQHRVTRTVSGTTNTNAHTVSFFAKASTRTRVYVGMAESPTFTRQGNAVFDLLTGTVVSTSTGAGGATGGSAAIQNVGNGWYRCSYTLTLGGADSAIFVDFNLVSSGTTISYTGNGTSGLFLFGAQIEAGAFPTSYIPTTTTALTRAADVASVNTLSPWFNSTVGTIYVEASNAQVQASLFSTDDGTASNRIVTYFNVANSPALRVVSGGVDQCNYSAGTITQNAAFKLAAAYQVNDFAASLNGAAVVTDTSGTIPTGQTTARIGTNVSLANSINGYLRRITYYPRRLTDAQLQQITA